MFYKNKQNDGLDNQKIYNYILKQLQQILKYHKGKHFMNLRSRKSQPINYQSQSQSQRQRNPNTNQSQTGNLRDMMKDNYIFYQQQILPPTINDLNNSNYNNTGRGLNKGNTQQFAPFILPTPHIQSESSIEIPDVQILQRTSPRRRRIFDDNRKSNYNFSKKSNPFIEKTQNKQPFSYIESMIAPAIIKNKNQNNSAKNFGSIANTPSFGGQSSLLNEKVQPKVNQFSHNIQAPPLSSPSPAFQNVDNIKKTQSLQSNVSGYDFLGNSAPTPPPKSPPNFGASQPITQAPNTNSYPIKTAQTRAKMTQSQTYQPSFHTLVSLKKSEQPNKNNSSIYYSPNGNFNQPSSFQQPSGISFKGKQPAANNSSYNHNSNTRNLGFGNNNQGTQRLKNPFTDIERHISRTINQSIGRKQSSQYHQLNLSLGSNSFNKVPPINNNTNSNIKTNEKIQNQILNPMIEKRRSNKEGQMGMLNSLANKSPTPVYQSEFYNNLGPSNNFQQKDEIEQNVTYQPFYTDPFKNNSKINSPNSNANFNNNVDKSKTNVHTKNPQINNNQTKNNNDAFLETLFTNIVNTQAKKPNQQVTNLDKRFQDFPKPHPLQHRQGMRIDTTQPILVGPETQPSRIGKKQSMSPFEQTEKQQIKYIPKRFDMIQSKVNKQQQQLQRLQKKLIQTHAQDLNSQKKLLNQLIRKEQELSLKQRQINHNLQQMKRLHQQNLIKKQQLIKYQLQLQQSKRIEELYKQNQRLYQELMKKQSINKINSPSTNLTYNYNFEQNIVPNAPITPTYEVIQRKKQYNPGDLLLSPFSLNPSHY